MRMNISDQELRALVRDSIARHGRTPASAPGPVGHVVHVSSGISASHGRFLLAAGSAAGEDGQCLIEPAVRCNHCGYCQSLGH
jgi:hypothetical protein